MREGGHAAEADAEPRPSPPLRSPSRTVAVAAVAAVAVPDATAAGGPNVEGPPGWAAPDAAGATTAATAAAVGGPDVEGPPGRVEPLALLLFRPWPAVVLEVWEGHAVAAVAAAAPPGREEEGAGEGEGNVVFLPPWGASCAALGLGVSLWSGGVTTVKFRWLWLAPRCASRPWGGGGWGRSGRQAGRGARV